MLNNRPTIKRVNLKNNILLSKQIDISSNKVNYDVSSNKLDISFNQIDVSSNQINLSLRNINSEKKLVPTVNQHFCCLVL